SDNYLYRLSDRYIVEYNIDANEWIHWDKKECPRLIEKDSAIQVSDRYLCLLMSKTNTHNELVLMHREERKVIKKWEIITKNEINGWAISDTHVALSTINNLNIYDNIHIHDSISIYPIGSP